MVLSAGTIHHGHIMSGEICNDDQNYLSCITLIFFFLYSNISLEICNEIKPSYSLQFRLCSMHDLLEQTYALNLDTMDASNIALNFKERARLIIQDIISDSVAKKVPSY